MKIIIGKPGTGKTKKMLQMSAENNIPVLCESFARKTRLLEKAAGYGFSIPQPIVFDDVDSTVDKVYVDDIQRLLEVALNVKLEAISINDTGTEIETL